MKGKPASSSHKTAVVVLLVAAVFIAVTVYFGLAFLGGGAMVNVQVPLIETRLMDDNGKDVRVQTLFSVQMDSKARRVLDNATLERVLTDIINDMDVEAIMGADSVTYMNDRATARLNAFLAEQEITTRVVVVDVLTGERGRLTGPNPGDKSDVQEGLFQHMN